MKKKITLTPEKVKNIYSRILNNETQDEIAKRYKVSRAHISKLKLGMCDNPPPHARWTWVWQEMNNVKKVVETID
jgi:transcriptional regulator